ncbi:rab-GTPase-TBC domain-containing protein [Gaertneriomyces semiglobifer]|nr:rab-GTPase-TBC domain-containing protein [Gaertneriomyces semiglobifer]
MSTGPFRPDVVLLRTSSRSLKETSRRASENKVVAAVTETESCPAPSEHISKVDGGVVHDGTEGTGPRYPNARELEEARQRREPPTMALLRLESFNRRQKMAIDEYGFYKERNEARPNPTSGAVKASTRKKKGKEQTWLDLLSLWERHGLKRNSKIKKLGRAGIPDSLRAKVWQALAGMDKVRQDGIYKDLLLRDDPHTFEVIERDIGRCFPEHSMFADERSQGQANLRNVLRAYAIYNPEVGYCQGMGMLAGMLLMRMPPEESFWMLVCTLETHLKNFFTPSLSQLRVDAAVFEVLLHRISKRAANHLDKQDVLPIMYITQWFLTAYITTLPWETVLRVWDMMYCEGIKPLFRIGLAIIHANRAYLLQECPTNAETLSFLLHLPHDRLEAEFLIERSLRVKITRKEIEHLRKRVASKATPERGTVSLIRRRRG